MTKLQRSDIHMEFEVATYLIRYSKIRQNTMTFRTRHDGHHVKSGRSVLLTKETATLVSMQVPPQRKLP